MFKSREQKAREAQAAILQAAVEAATAAKEAGRSIFQYMDVVSTTKGEIVPMLGAFSTEVAGSSMGSLSPIESIESVGWRLIDTGYVYQQTLAESRDKFMASGQQEAYSGRILGIYTFRVDK